MAIPGVAAICNQMDKNTEEPGQKPKRRTYNVPAV